MSSESEKIKSTILRQLEYGACCRNHIHRECCGEFGLERPRIDRSEDRRFDARFDELVEDRLVRKIHAKTMTINGKKLKIACKQAKEIDKISRYTFYELTKKGKEFLNKSRKLP